MPDVGRQRLGDEDEAAPGHDGQEHVGPVGEFTAPGAGRVDDGRCVQVAARGAHAAHRAVAGAQHPGHLVAGEQSGTGRAQQVGRRESGHHLGVLRVAHPAREPWREAGFQVVEAVGGDELGGHPGRTLGERERPERVE